MLQDGPQCFVIGVIRQRYIGMLQY